MNQRLSEAVHEQKFSDKLKYLFGLEKKTTARELMLAYEEYLKVLREENAENLIIAIQSGYTESQRQPELRKLWAKVQELKKNV
jgi:hypothetical protein